MNVNGLTLPDAWLERLSIVEVTQCQMGHDVVVVQDSSDGSLSRVHRGNANPYDFADLYACAYWNGDIS